MCPMIGRSKERSHRDGDLHVDKQPTLFCVWRRDFNITEFDTPSESQSRRTNLFELVLGSFVSRLLIRKKHFHVVVMLVFDVFKQSLLIC